MSYSSSDFSTDIENALHEHILVPREADLEQVRDIVLRLFRERRECLAALHQIAAAEPRPRRDGSYRAHDVENMQRAARLAAGKVQP